MQERNGNHGYARTAKSLNEKSRSELSSSATPTIKPSHSVKDEEGICIKMQSLLKLYKLI